MLIHALIYSQGPLTFLKEHVFCGEALIFLIYLRLVSARSIISTARRVSAVSQQHLWTAKLSHGSVVRCYQALFPAQRKFLWFFVCYSRSTIICLVFRLIVYILKHSKHLLNFTDSIFFINCTKDFFGHCSCLYASL